MIISTLLSKHTDGREAYQSVYNEFFTDEFCAKVRNILEIGVQKGIGVKAWIKTFPEAEVYGFDIDPSTGAFKGDSAVRDDVERFFNLIPVKMDVIIDDADHQATSQLATLRNFWPHLAPSGIYVMEDTGCRAVNDPFVIKIRDITSGNVQPRCANGISGLIVIQHAS